MHKVPAGTINAKAKQTTRVDHDQPAPFPKSAHAETYQHQGHDMQLTAMNADGATSRTRVETDQLLTTNQIQKAGAETYRREKSKKHQLEHKSPAGTNFATKAKGKPRVEHDQSIIFPTSALTETYQYHSSIQALKHSSMQAFKHSSIFLRRDGGDRKMPGWA